MDVHVWKLEAINSLFSINCTCTCTCSCTCNKTLGILVSEIDYLNWPTAETVQLN